VDRQAEMVRLGESDRHIATAEKNVSEQRMHVEKLRQHGHDLELAEKMLRGFEASLTTLREHRELSIKTIEEIDKGNM
jgi:hypothetical protein